MLSRGHHLSLLPSVFDVRFAVHVGVPVTLVPVFCVVCFSVPFLFPVFSVRVCTQ